MVTCNTCKKEIDVFEEGYFEENKVIYCEKCYAEKRFKEVDDATKAKWLENVLAVVRSEMRGLSEEDKKKVKEKWKKKIPTAFETKL
ncbi:MAG: hypothetical protein QXK12_08635 [Candidatus Nezhaarchaeales archaeon]